MKCFLRLSIAIIQLTLKKNRHMSIHDSIRQPKELACSQIWIWLNVLVDLWLFWLQHKFDPKKVLHQRTGMNGDLWLIVTRFVYENFFTICFPSLPSGFSLPLLMGSLNILPRSLTFGPAFFFGWLFVVKKLY